MKTPTVKDSKPKRENLGPTGPAKVSGGDSKGEESNTTGSAPSGDPGEESEIEKVINRKRGTASPD